MELKITLKKIDNKPGEYGKEYMKIKLNLNDNLLLNELLKLHLLTIFARSVFKEDTDFFR